MKVGYNIEVDILRISFSEARVEESNEDKPGVILDYDVRGNIVGIEILDASQQMPIPQSVNEIVLSSRMG